MGRKKIVIKRIGDLKKRSTTYMKRKKGLLKKAMELSILCDCEVSVVVNGEDYVVYSSRNIDEVFTQLTNKSGITTYSNSHYEELFGDEAETNSVTLSKDISSPKRRKLDDSNEPTIAQGMQTMPNSEYTVASLQSLAYQQASMIQTLMHQQAALISQLSQPNVTYDSSNTNDHSSQIEQKQILPAQDIAEQGNHILENDSNIDFPNSPQKVSSTSTSVNAEDNNVNSKTSGKQLPKSLDSPKKEKETDAKRPSLKISIPSTPTIFSIPSHLKSSTAPNILSMMSPVHFNPQITPSSNSSSDSNEWLNNFISSPHLQFQSNMTPTLFPNFPNFLQSPKM